MLTNQKYPKILSVCAALVALVMSIPSAAFASADMQLQLPKLDTVVTLFGSSYTAHELLTAGLLIPILGVIFGLIEFSRVKSLPVHTALAEISSLIYETCKTYMIQQAKFLLVLQLIIAAFIVYYFSFLIHQDVSSVLTVIVASVVGVTGSFGVAWFGIRINTYANSRTAFASLAGKPYKVMSIPLQSGIAIGVMLISVELILLLGILLFVPSHAVASCFFGFAIGESLGASALRICGGIFTKIADIGSDLMKIVFKIKEDDARNPGVIADCAGDNAGDSVGPTADGFETYGVTAVALITFTVLAVGQNMINGIPGFTPEKAHELQANVIFWIFTLAIVLVPTSIVAYWVNGLYSRAKYSAKASFNFEAPLTSLVWITSILSIVATFLVTHFVLGNLAQGLWWKLSVIISCGTFAAALIPEFTKVFTSSKSKHVHEIVDAAREGGASLAILSGLVAGNFSAFWKGLTIAGLMFIAYITAMLGLQDFMVSPAVFAFGLVAFGLLSMAPVTIAVDSFGPVSDNAQSVFELSQIETRPGVEEEIKSKYGFNPNFTLGKAFLEESDSAGNTFKATAKPVLIGTAVIGATTMIFSLILKHNLKLDLVDPHVLLGLIAGGAIVYWFCGASMQAVTTGAYRAVEYIKNNINLDVEKASVKDSKEVVRICTQFAQKGMVNIFAVVLSFTVAFACFSPTFFASYLVSLAIFGLYQAIFMANAGGAWDNAKKYVEVDLHEKGTDLHAAMVIGDTVGDPFKDTSSVALNPIIKFTTLFGLLAVDIAIAAEGKAIWIGGVLLLVGFFFVHRSFYGMRIKVK